MNGTLRAFTGYLSAECGMAENTVAAYQSDIESVTAHLEALGLTVRAANTEQLREYVQAQTLAGRATSTVTRRIVVLKLFYQFLGLATADALDKPKPTDYLPQTLSQDQVNRLISAPLPTMLGLRDVAILELLYASGVRASELCALGMADANLRTAELRVWGKGNKERIVPIGQCAVQATIRYIQQARHHLNFRKKSDRLFLSRTGLALDRHSLWYIVRRHADTAGLLNEVGPHTLRHSFASHLVSGGADLRTVQELLGHSNIETTEKYVHVDADRLKAVHRDFHPRP